MREPILLIFVALILVIFIVSYFFSKKAVIKRKLKKAEFKRIDNFRNGDVAKIVGQVEFVEKPLISPLAKRKCAYYYIHIEQQVSSGKSTRWKTIIEEEVSSKFLIRDGDHYAFINDDKLKSYIVQDRSFSSGFFNDTTLELENFLTLRGHKSENFLGFNKTLRYKEGILENEEKIAVFGKGIWKDATELELPKKYGKVLAITANNGTPIYLSDDPNTTIKKAKKNDFLMNKRKPNHDRWNGRK